LISRLARHTRNLEGDARASLLLDATGSAGDPLEGGRLTLIGEVGPSASPSAVARFLARHPEAEAYAAFPDFSAYVMRVLQGHYIGGFGRIVGLPAADLCTDTAEAASLMAAETGILEHMNSDHPDAVALYATSLAGQPPGAWRMVGIDPDGIDLRSGEHVARIEFPAPVLTPDAARAALVALVQKARAG
jgi:putative heme iron utilization protein